MVATYTRINSHILLYSHQPYYILLYTNSLLTIPFSRLISNMYSGFPIKSVVTVKKTSVNRYQIRLTLGFAFIEYKVQSATFEFIVLDLQQKSRKRKRENYKQFCFTYVQFFQLQILQGVFLLKK